MVNVLSDKILKNFKSDKCSKTMMKKTTGVTNAISFCHYVWNFYPSLEQVSGQNQTKV